MVIFFDLGLKCINKSCPYFTLLDQCTDTMPDDGQHGVNEDEVRIIRKRGNECFTGSCLYHVVYKPFCTHSMDLSVTSEQTVDRVQDFLADSSSAMLVVLLLRVLFLNDLHYLKLQSMMG